jgi:hypothetical protein
VAILAKAKSDRYIASVLQGYRAGGEKAAKKYYRNVKTGVANKGFYYCAPNITLRTTCHDRNTGGVTIGSGLVSPVAG